MTRLADSADVIVIGAGAAGLAAGLAAARRGARVIVVDENDDVGGHAILSGGWVELGGGTAVQRRHGFTDSPQSVFTDWFSYSGARFDDPQMVWSLAQASAETVQFLLDAGVEFTETHAPLTESTGDVPRRFRVAQWPHTAEVPVPGRAGAGLIRPLERAAQAYGVQFRLATRFESLVTDSTGQVEGAIVVGRAGRSTLRATRSVVLATGGHTSHVGFRRMIDPRLSDIYQVAGEPYSRQSAAAELAGLALGAALWGLGAQTRSRAHTVSKPTSIGCRWGYRNLVIGTDSRLFTKARATGLPVADWSDLILVGGNGIRFHDENAEDDDFLEAALTCTSADPGADRAAPVWAIFDAAHVRRQGWIPEKPWVDRDGFFFEADTVAELAQRVQPSIGCGTLDPAVLTATVSRYNKMVAEGVDRDFGKTGLRYPVATPPFYAAWATPMLHDSLTGLRTDGEGQVLRVNGTPIHGLFAAGECQGGFSQHGLGRALTFGRLAGNAATQHRADHATSTSPAGLCHGIPISGRGHIE